MVLVWLIKKKFFVFVFPSQIHKEPINDLVLKAIYDRYAYI